MTKTISANEAKNRLGAWIGYVNDQDEEVIIERHGKPRAVIMSIDAFEELQQLRDKQRRAETVDRLRALREEVSAANRDLTEQQIEQVADRMSRDMIDHMAATGRLVFERDRTK